MLRDLNELTLYCTVAENFENQKTPIEVCDSCKIFNSCNQARLEILSVRQKYRQNLKCLGFK